VSAYFIADVKVHDLEAYRASGYLEAARASAADFGGNYVARGGETVVFEGEWVPNRLVIIEFPDLASMRAWHSSVEYEPWKKIRQSLADSNIVGIDGV